MAWPVDDRSTSGATTRTVPNSDATSASAARPGLWIPSSFETRILMQATLRESIAPASLARVRRGVFRGSGRDILAAVMVLDSFAHGLQCDHRRAVYGVPVDLKPRPVTRTIPRSFEGVPPHHTAQMRAERRSLVKLAVLVAVHGHFRGAPTEDRAFAGLHLPDVAHFTRCDEIGVLNGDVQVFFRELLDGSKRLPGGIVEPAQGFSRPTMRSVRSMPAIVPCVMPLPESPVAM